MKSRLAGARENGVDLSAASSAGALCVVVLVHTRCCPLYILRADWLAELDPLRTDCASFVKAAVPVSQFPSSNPKSCHPYLSSGKVGPHQQRHQVLRQRFRESLPRGCSYTLLTRF